MRGSNQNGNKVEDTRWQGTGITPNDRHVHAKKNEHETGDSGTCGPPCRGQQPNSVKEQDGNAPSASGSNSCSLSVPSWFLATKPHQKAINGSDKKINSEKGSRRSLRFEAAKQHGGGADCGSQEAVNATCWRAFLGAGCGCCTANEAQNSSAHHVRADFGITRPRSQTCLGCGEADGAGCTATTWHTKPRHAGETANSNRSWRRTRAKQQEKALRQAMTDQSRRRCSDRGRSLCHEHGCSHSTRLGRHLRRQRCATEGNTEQAQTCISRRELSIHHSRQSLANANPEHAVGQRKRGTDLGWVRRLCGPQAQACHWPTLCLLSAPCRCLPCLRREPRIGTELHLSKAVERNRQRRRNGDEEAETDRCRRSNRR